MNKQLSQLATKEHRDRCLAEAVSVAIQEFYRVHWNEIGYGKRLYRALRSVSDVVRASSVVVIDLEHETAFSCAAFASWEYNTRSLNFTSKSPANPGRKSIAEKEVGISNYVSEVIRETRNTVETKNTRHISDGEPFCLEGDGIHCDFLIGFSAVSKPESSFNGESGTSSSVFSCLLFHWNGVAKLLRKPWQDDDGLERLNSEIKNELRRQLGGNVLPLVLDAFRYYERRFAAFSPKVRQCYWQAISSAGKGRTPAALLSPPWDECVRIEGTVPTVTMSLDLRKSTYCMEYAASYRRFGHWLEMFTEKMRSVAHLHGGIYDKFTGDGCLVHFLEKECQAVRKLPAIDSAVHCAVDMQLVAERHMKELRQFLQHDSPLFGAGIAIDLNEAYWACDDRDNPVVVGRGVVGACRVGDRAGRKMIRLTNLAFCRLSRETAERIPDPVQYELETKDSPGGLPLLCWQFDSSQARGIGFGLEAMEKLCERVYNKFSRRSKRPV